MFRLADIKATPFALRRAFKQVFEAIEKLEKKVDALEASSGSEKPKRKYSKKENKEI
jgi:hypothetical protein